MLSLLHHHHVVPPAQISLTLSRHFSLSFITSGWSSGLHPVSSQSCCMYVRAGRPAFARPYVGVHRNTSLLRSIYLSLSIYLSISICSYLSIYLSIYLSLFISIYECVLVCVCVCVCVFVCVINNLKKQLISSWLRTFSLLFWTFFLLSCNSWFFCNSKTNLYGVKYWF